MGNTVRMARAEGHVEPAQERSHLLRRVQAHVAASTAGHTGSATDELIAERRAEAAREDWSPDATVQNKNGRPLVEDSSAC